MPRCGRGGHGALEGGLGRPPGGALIVSRAARLVTVAPAQAIEALQGQGPLGQVRAASPASQASIPAM